MPVVYRGQISAAAVGTAGKVIARNLAGLCANHFADWRVFQPGLGVNSCCAAVATVPDGTHLAVQSPFGPAPLPFSVTFGNSQMAAGGLVWPGPGAGVIAGHAERSALTVANHEGVALWPRVANTYILYVEMAPCVPCQNWLIGIGGGVANPYNFGPASPHTLEVWWGWPYTAAGYAAMGAAHGQPIANQLLTITGW